MIDPHLLFGDANVDVTVGIIPSGYSMAPPKLAANAPVLDVTHPRKVGVLPLFGYKTNRTILDCANSGFRQLFRIDVPLRREPRLNDGPRPIPSGDFQRVGLDLI